MLLGMLIQISDIIIKRKPRPLEETHILKIPYIQIGVNLIWKCNGNSLNHYFILKNRGELFNNLEGKDLSDFISKGLKINLNLNFPVNKLNTKEKLLYS